MVDVPRHSFISGHPGVPNQSVRAPGEQQRTRDRQLAEACPAGQRVRAEMHHVR